jgi:hypothetical protein
MEDDQEHYWRMPFCTPVTECSEISCTIVRIYIKNKLKAGLKIHMFVAVAYKAPQKL